jgi:outer membrane protein assembly factor BamB
VKRIHANIGVLVYVLLMGAGRAPAQDWPQWAGPNRDNKVKGFTEPKTWPKELKQQYRVPVGMGESSPVLVGDKLYVFTRQKDDEVLTCLDAATGKTVWQDKYAAEAVEGKALAMAGLGPGPRSTPAVADGKICTLGVGGVVSCLDAATGKVLWRKDTKAKPVFYTRASPMIVEGMCIVHLDALTALDLANGETKWRWKAPGSGLHIPYGSPVLLTVDGVKQVVAPDIGYLVSVALADGKQLWRVKCGQTYFEGFSTPIIDGQTVIYSTQNVGTLMFKVEKQGDGVTATALRKPKEAETAADRLNVPVLKDGLLYGITYSSAKNYDFYCMDARTANVLWKDRSPRGRSGVILDCGTVLMAYTFDGTLVAFRPSNKEYAELALYKIAETTSYTYPIIAGNRIFVKDRDSLALWTIE